METKNLNLTDKEIYDEVIRQKRVDILVKHKWGFELSPGQIEIVRKIAFMESKKLSISAMTRYGKTQCVACGVGLLLDFGVPAKIAFLGPKEEQAGIIRQYLSELIVTDKSLLSKAQLFATGADRLGKEASKKRMTFVTGAEYRVFSGEGDADRLMGFGCVPSEAEIITNNGIKTAEQIWKNNNKPLIYSYNHKKNKCEFQRIKRRIKNPGRDLIKIYHEAGSFIVTDNHPIYIKGKGYIQAKNVCNKDKLFKCNCYSNLYGNNKMLSMRKHNKPQTKSHSKSKETFLQSQMQRRMAKRTKQSIMGWWKKANYLQRMWQRVLYQQKPNKKEDILQYEMQRLCKKEKTKSKDKTYLQTLWKRIRNNSSKERISVLFKKLCQQRPCRSNVDGKKSSMERWNQKSTMGSRFQQKTQIKDKRKRWSQVFFMWKDWILANTPYRLQQEKQQRRKLDDSMPQLSLQDELQARDVEKVIVTSIERLPAQRETYNFEVENNNNYFVNGILTHNCDILIRDEACLINRAAYTKSSRMLGDNPEEAIEIELLNPWNRDNKAFEHTLDPAWEVIQIGWPQAVREGRTTKKFVMQQKRDLLPLEFTVLYESQFPDQSEDSLFSLEWIKMAEKTKFNFQDKLDRLVEEVKELKKKRKTMAESEYVSRNRGIQQKLDAFKKIVACDPAEMGLDETVIVWGIEWENKIQVVGSYFEAKSDPMRVVGKIIDITENFIEPEVRGAIHIDRIGIGSGPLSRLKEVIKEKEIKNVSVVGCHYGERAIMKDIFLNKKSENYFRLADIMRNNLIDIPENHKIRHQLISEKWERTSANKKKVIDPEEKSPDWGDALVYLVWKDKSGLAFGFA